MVESATPAHKWIRRVIVITGIPDFKPYLFSVLQNSKVVSFQTPGLKRIPEKNHICGDPNSIYKPKYSRVTGLERENGKVPN